MERTIRPRPQVLEALKGEVLPVTTLSNKPGHIGELVSVRVAKEGPAMAGLSDVLDNKEWSGLFNHELLTARYSVYFSRKMKDAGYDTNPERLLNVMIDSHLGRRQWDEADWYRAAVGEIEAEKRRSVSNETLGIRLIEGKVPQDVFELVVALGHDVEGFSVDPSIYESWDYKLAIYVDHRTSQQYLPLTIRMGDFLLGNFFGRDKVNGDVRNRVYQGMRYLIERQKAARLGIWGVNHVMWDMADRIAERLGANSTSERLSRKQFMNLVLQDADTEAALVAAGIDPDAVSDKTVPMPKWERYLRRLYINDAEEGIFNLQTRELLGDEWWGNYVWSLLYKSGDKSYESNKGKPRGIQRAIEFFRYLDKVHDDKA